MAKAIIAGNKYGPAATIPEIFGGAQELQIPHYRHPELRVGKELNPARVSGSDDERQGACLERTDTALLHSMNGNAGQNICRPAAKEAPVINIDTASHAAAG